MWRIQRVNQLIKKELSQILLREFNPPEEILVTVTRVETSADLAQAKIYISIIPSPFQVIKILNSKASSYQHQLNKRLKMKKIPKIKFVEEKQTAQAAKIEEILAQIHQND